MALSRRIVFYLFILLALAGAAWAYFYLRESKKPSLKAEDVLPDSTFCCFSSNSFNGLANKLSNQNLLWNEMINISAFKSLHAQIQFFDSVITENESLRSFFKEKEIFLALYNAKPQASTLIVFNLDDLAQEKDFEEALRAAFKSSGDEENKLELAAPGKKWSIKLNRGVVVMTDALPLIEKVFSGTSRKLKDNAQWQALQKMHNDNELLSIYVNHALLNQNARASVNTSGTILGGGSFAVAEFNPDELSLNGFNLPDSSSLLNTLTSQQPQPCDFFSALPFNTLSFTAVGFHDFPSWRRKLKPITSSFWKTVNDSAMYNAEGEFYNNIGTKIIEAEIKFRDKISKALWIEVKDTARSAELLNYISDTIRVYQGVKMAMMDSLTGNLVSASFGKVFHTKPGAAFVLGNYFVLAEANIADYLVNASVNGSTILQNEWFRAYAKDNLGLNFNYLYYTALNRQSGRLKQVLAFLKESDVAYFKKFSDFSISMANYKTMLQFRMNLKYQQEQKNSEAPGLWTFEADTLVHGRPGVFVNHKTGENEIVLSDEKNNLYLVNATGNLLWKVHLEEAVVSDVYTVDAFKNNKFQMLFNTRNYIYLIDRNGKNVDGFPVRLPAPATNSLTLFDYDGTKDYRLFIACEDKHIYNFGINGVRNEKFVPVKTDDVVKLPLSYLKVAGSDYLVTADAGGKIYVFSRRGEDRIGLNNRLIENCQSFYAEASGSLQNTRLIYVDDKNSLLETISLADKKEALKLDTDLEEARYAFDMVDDDKKPDLILVDKNRLLCYDLTGNLIYEWTGAEEQFSLVNYFYDADGAYFILSTGEQLEVLNVSTKTVVKKFKTSGPPVISDLFRDGKKYILAAEGKTLKCVILK